MNGKWEAVLVPHKEYVKAGDIGCGYEATAKEVIKELQEGAPSNSLGRKAYTEKDLARGSGYVGWAQGYWVVRKVEEKENEFGEVSP